MDPTMLNVAGKNAIVDWVFIEVRDKNDAAVVLESKVGLIQRDGDVVDTSGVARLLFSVLEDDHFVSLWHRNHLGAMTLNTVALSDQETTVDLSDPLTDTYGTDARKIDGGVARLWCGNALPDASRVDLEEAVRSRTFGVNDSLGDSLSVEFCELVNQMHVLEEDGSSGSSGL